MTLAQLPWAAAHDGHGGICLDDAQGRRIGFLSARHEQDAHAALFVAAPDLLAALQELRYACTDKAEAMADAAIAKATGAKA